MINWTVGTGGTYANFVAAEAALPATLADNYTWTQISNITEAGTIQLTGSNFNGYNITVTQNVDPKGDPTVGWKNTMGGGGRWLLAGAGNGYIQFDKMHIVGVAGQPCIEWVGPIDLRVTNCLLHGVSQSFEVNNTVNYTMALIMHDNKAWAAGIPWIITNQNGLSTTSFTLENNIFYNSTGGDGVDLNAGATRVITARNNYASGWDDIGNSTGYNNASSDASDADANWSTASDNLNESLVEADIFDSLVDTNSGFLKPKNVDDGGQIASASATPTRGKVPLEVQFTSGLTGVDPTGDLLNAGTTPTYATTSIEGRDRPNSNGGSCVGAHEISYDTLS